MKAALQPDWDPRSEEVQRDQLAAYERIHVYPEAPLARLELRVVVEELLQCSKNTSIKPQMTPCRARFAVIN